jgi:hypothetical protein
MARQGLAVLRRPVPALGAIFFQCLGWLTQLLAVWAVMEAFNLDLPLPAAGLVLVLMNVAIIFPLWPGNVGLLQAAVALPLGQYGVAYATGFAYALVLQAVEMSVGVAVGLVFLAREGLSLASLKTMEEEQESEENTIDEEAALTDRNVTRAAVTELGARHGPWAIARAGPWPGQPQADDARSRLPRACAGGGRVREPCRLRGNAAAADGGEADVDEVRRPGVDARRAARPRSHPRGGGLSPRSRSARQAPSAADSAIRSGTSAAQEEVPSTSRCWVSPSTRASS